MRDNTALLRPQHELDNRAKPASVALVVLSYNYGRFVAQAIDSALCQTVPYEQIIVVDDGSKDDSRFVLDHYQSRVELVYKANGGQLSAALYALERVRCDYVHYLDSDDYLVPNARELIARELAPGSIDSEGDAPDHAKKPAKLQFRLRCVSSSGSLDSVVPAYPAAYSNALQLRDAQLLGMSICPPTSGNVFRTQSLRVLPCALLDPRDYIDGTPNMAMLYLGEVRSVDTIIANYRIHGANNGLAHAPTIEVFEQELTRLRRRWYELQQIFPRIEIPSIGSTLLELEARNLIAAMEGRRAVGLALAYAHKLVLSGKPLRHKLLLGPWMLALALAPAQHKEPMIRARRSAANRSKLTRKLVGLYLGHSQALG